MVGVYPATYGPVNFLWFSDIALILTVPAMWLQNPLLASMMAIATLLPEIGWTISFCCRLFFISHFGDATAYMFAGSIPWAIRALSLFHLFLPLLLLWMLDRLGYDRRAWIAQTLLCWIVLPLTFFLTQPKNNINWVFGPGALQHFMPPASYLIAEMMLIPLLIYLPTHAALRRAFRPPLIEHPSK